MYVHVKANPASKVERVTKISHDRYEIWVREKAERNAANKKVAELLARSLQVDPKTVRLISGHTSPSKLFSIFDSSTVRRIGPGGVQG